jgi:hypothetical protein
MNTFINRDSKKDKMEIRWDAETAFKLVLGEARLTPIDCSTAFLILRLANIKQITVMIYNIRQSLPSESLQKWIKACVALKRRLVMSKFKFKFRKQSC